MSNVDKIPESFINQYIERYNAGNKIEEVWLETELKEIDCPDNIEGCEVFHQKEFLKLNPDNTVIIVGDKPLTKREELINKALFIIKDEATKSNIRQYLNINDFGYSQVERNIVEAIINLTHPE